MKVLRVFVSSPGDVGRERVLAGHVLDRLQGEFHRRVIIEPYFWEHEPMRAVTDYQGNIPQPSAFDIVICILWSRLGSPLNEKYRHADGSPYASGTEYEFETSVEAHQLAGKPELLIYRNRQQPMIPMEPEEQRNEKIRQFEALQGFLKRWFLNPDGTIRIASNDYHDLASFEEKLENNLRVLIDQLAPRLAEAQQELVPAGAYAKGSPFRQLRPFEFEDADIFFGRTKAIDEVLTAMRDQAAAGLGFTLLFGSSGSGKSSLARAGVLPMLVRPGVIEGVGLWRWTIMRPSEAVGDIFDGLAAALLATTAVPEIRTNGGATLTDLAKALREAPAGVPLLIKSSLAQAARDVQAKELLAEPPAARLVIVIDQFEEMFTLSARFSPDMRALFVKTLAELAHSGAVWILATLRSEFYSRCEEIPELVKLKSGKGQCQLLPPTESELRQVVRLPAIVAGLQFEVDADGSRLDDTLVDAAGRNAGSLPLLEFALEELYKRRRDDTWLTHGALKEMKGIEGALESAAEDVFGKLAPEVSAEFGAVFRGLVTTDLNEEATFLRRVADLDALANTKERRNLIDAFCERRLLVTGGDAANRPDLQVAHEALFLHWPRLTRMLAENREFLHSRARAGAASSLWQAQDRERSYLWWSGRQFKQAKSLLVRAEELTTQETKFAKASVEAGEAADRNRWIAVAAASIIAIAAGASGYLWLQNWRTEREVTGLREKLARVVADPSANAYEIAKSAGQILAKKPGDSDTWGIFARALLNQGDYNGFDAAIERWQQNVSPMPAGIERLKGDREWKQRHKEAAIQHWEAWLRQPSLSLEERKVVWKNLATAYGELKQWTEARNRLTEWIAASDSVEARVLRAKASQQLRDWDAAAQDIAWAQKADPSNPAVTSFGPIVSGEAIDALNARVRKNPRDPAAWLARGNALTRERQFEAALEDIEHAQNLAPDGARPAIEKAHLLWQLGRPIPEAPPVRVAETWTRDMAEFGKAFDAAQPALDVLSAADARIADSPGEAGAFLERGDCLLRLGQWEMAVDDFTHALELDNHLDKALAGRAAAFRALGRTEEADADLRRANELQAEPKATP
jgi:tetratricopeptide (TPR) repeat protein